MFSISNLLVSSAWAQAVAPAGLVPGGATGNAGLMNYLPFLLLLAVWYFIVIRPQNQKVDAQNKMIKALQRGDRIVTSGGIHGKIVRTEGDDILGVEIADGVVIRVDRAQVQGLEAKTEPVVTDANGTK